MTDWLFPGQVEAPNKPKSMRDKREDWKELVGEDYWAQFIAQRSQDTLFPVHSPVTFWKPPFPIDSHAFFDDEGNVLVSVTKEGIVCVDGLAVEEQHVKKFWTHLAKAMSYSDKVRACFNYKDSHPKCAKMVADFEEHDPDAIPSILDGSYQFKELSDDNFSVLDLDDG